MYRTLRRRGGLRLSREEVETALQSVSLDLIGEEEAYQQMHFDAFIQHIDDFQAVMQDSSIRQSELLRLKYRLEVFLHGTRSGHE